MKKKYESPVAEMVAFDYEENVTASGPSTQTNTGCFCGCKQHSNPTPPSYSYTPFWFVSCVEKLFH